MKTTPRFSFARCFIVTAVAVASAACGVDAANAEQAPPIESVEPTDTNAAPLRVSDPDTVTADTVTADMTTSDSTTARRAHWCSLTTDGGQWCCSTDANGKLYCWKVPPPDVIYTFTRY